MIGIGQATYLKTLISQYVAAENALGLEHEHGGDIDDYMRAVENVNDAERKLNNYIAKLTETGK